MKKTSIRTFIAMVKLLLFQDSLDVATIDIVYHGATQKDFDKVFDTFSPIGFQFEHFKSWCEPLNMEISYTRVRNLKGHNVASIHYAD